MTKARDIASAAPAPSTVSATELGYLDGVSSAIQTQLDGKASTTADIPKSLIDAKGDLIVGSAADTAARLAVGTNNHVLTADSSATNGVKWAAAGSSFVGASAVASSNQTISNATETAINFDGTDLFDTDAYHNPSSNNSRMTIPAGKAGKYAVYGRINIDTTSTTGRRILEVYKNGTQVPYLNIEVTPISDQTILTAGIISLAEGDYIELYFYQTSGINLTTYSGYCGFSIQYLGA